MARLTDILQCSAAEIDDAIEANKAERQLLLKVKSFVDRREAMSGMIQADIVRHQSFTAPAAVAYAVPRAAVVPPLVPNGPTGIPALPTATGSGYGVPAGHEVEFGVTPQPEGEYEYDEASEVDDLDDEPAPPPPPARRKRPVGAP